MSEKQVLSIREADARLNIWQGAVRSGKSFASLYRFLHFVRFGPEGPLIIVGRTTRTITTNIIDPMRDILGDYVKYWIGKGELNIFGRKIYAVSANDARAEAKIRGSTFVGAYVDEMTLIPETFVKMLLSRLSMDGAKLFGTTNPDSPYHWLKRDFIDRAGELDLRTWCFRLEDNPSLGADFVKQIKSEYSGLWYQRFIEGRWVQAEGAIYDFFDPQFHCIDSPSHPASFYLCGLDYGTTNPFAAVLIGVNFDYFPNMWVEDEYYFDSRVQQRQKTDYEYAEDLMNFLKGRYVKAVYVDPSAASFKLELMKRGLDNLYDAENEVSDGIRTVAQYLTQGTLKVTRRCKHLISEFQSYVWDSKSNKLGVDKPLKENDHALDALRYVLYTHFFGKDGGSLTARDLDKMYAESRGHGPELPRFFQAPFRG
jgi:PBSX family phage terminase large subunit